MGTLFPLVSRVRAGDGKLQPAYEISCVRCGAVDTISAHATRFPDDKLTQMFRYRGWHVGRRGTHVCPTCAEARKHERQLVRDAEVDPWDALVAPWLEGKARATVTDVAIGAIGMQKGTLSGAQMARIRSCFRRLGWEGGARGTGGRRWYVPRKGDVMSKPEPIPARGGLSAPIPSPVAGDARVMAGAAQAPAIPSPAAGKALVDLYVTLEDVYLRDRKAYKDGYDDARVARELGLSPDLVAKRREQDFGPLVRDTTLEDLRAEANALGHLHGVIRQQIQETHANLMTLDGRFADLQKIMDRIGALQARIVSVDVREDKAGAP